MAESPSFIVGLGPSHATRACEVPRHRPRNSTIAGDRPPRYGTGSTVFSLNDRGGQAPALRDREHRLLVERSRGTGPRATGTSRSGSLSYREEIETRRSLLRGFMKHPHNSAKFGGWIQNFFASASRSARDFSNSADASGSGIPRIRN